jgi:cytoskeletal protein CcmA (bactofilin family)
MFSKKQVPQSPAPRQPGKANMSASPSFSVLGADMAIVGDITAGAELHIDGRVEGDISCASLIQGEGSEIRGAVKVDTARLAGKVRGTISAGDLVILKTAQIDGDVEYVSLTIERGAKVGGRMSLRNAAALEPSLAIETSGEPMLILTASAT